MSTRARRWRRGTPRPGSRPRLALVAVAAALVGALLASCSAPPRYGVSTTVVEPTGTCNTARVVAVGASLALSGPEAPIGREYLTGLEMAVGHVNATGGVLRDHDCLELLYKDDRGSVPVARQAVLDLVNREQVSALVGPILSAQADGAGSALARANVPAASFSTLDQTFRRAAEPWTFPLTASTASLAQPITAFGAKSGWQRVAIIATDDPAGRQGAAALAAALTRRGVAVTGQELVTTRAQADRAVARLRDTQPDALVLLGDTSAIAGALQARHAAGWDVPVVASSVVVDPSVVATTGTGALSGVSVIVPTAVVARPGVPEGDVRAFRDQLRTRLRRSRLTGSVVPYAQGYDAVSMLASAIQSSHSLTAANVRSFLENANYQGLLASYSYSASAHTGIPTSQLVVAPTSRLSDGLFSEAPGP